MASIPQSWDWLENRRGQDDKMFRGVWKIVETEIRKTKVAEAEGGREKARKGKEVKREGAKKKRRNKKKRIIKVKEIAEEWEIWNREKETARYEEEARKLVS